MQRGAYADPWYFTVVLHRPINRDNWRHSLSTRYKFSIQRRDCSPFSQRYCIAGISNSRVEFLLFQRGYHPCSERFWVSTFKFSWSVKPLLSNDIGRNSRSEWINLSLGELRALKMYAYAMGSRLLGLIWTGLWRHQNIAEFSEVVEFLSLLLDFIYIISAS